jgi:hypothetical protein
MDRRVSASRGILAARRVEEETKEREASKSLVEKEAI